ncbi:patatin-like phospholipase family protein [Limibacter armeniacum]|uniref:patatin-like phospholipase family protein n=1 Tax=Limibacter armeniacum TaxID=466084 RepID=UPI002FE61516
MQLSNQSVGIAMSGGGAKGLAHVGVLMYLEEIGINTNIVAGTSAGAIVGALYAAGHRPDAIIDFFVKTPLFSFSNFLSLTQGWRGLVDPEKLYKYFEPYIPNDDFTSLEKKLRVIATDMVKAKETMFTEGSVIRAILASSAFPLFFAPVEANGTSYADGGIINHFPADAIRRECEYLIGVYVSPLKEVNTQQMRSVKNILERSLELKGHLAEKSKFVLCDVMIYMDELQEFATFDTDEDILREIVKIGYEKAKSHHADFIKLKSELNKTRTVEF